MYEQTLHGLLISSAIICVVVTLGAFVAAAVRIGKRQWRASPRDKGYFAVFGWLAFMLIAGDTLGLLMAFFEEPRGE